MSRRRPRAESFSGDEDDDGSSTGSAGPRSVSNGTDDGAGAGAGGGGGGGGGEEGGGPPMPDLSAILAYSEEIAEGDGGVMENDLDLERGGRSRSRSFISADDPACGVFKAKQVGEDGVTGGGFYGVDGEDEEVLVQQRTAELSMEARTGPLRENEVAALKEGLGGGAGVPDAVGAPAEPGDGVGGAGGVGADSEVVGGEAVGGGGVGASSLGSGDGGDSLLQGGEDDEEEVERREAEEEKLKHIHQSPRVKKKIKLLMLGDSCVGKTSLISRWTENSFSATLVGTVGVDYKAKVLNMGDTELTVQVWDTAGQEKFHKITRAYYRGAHGIMLVFDVSDRQSFDNIAYWIRNITQHATNQVRVFLIGNKIDLRSGSNSQCVDKRTAKRVASDNNVTYFECSAKSGTGVDQAFRAAAKDVHQNTSSPEQRLASAAAQRSKSHAGARGNTVGGRRVYSTGDIQSRAAERAGVGAGSGGGAGGGAAATSGAGANASPAAANPPSRGTPATANGDGRRRSQDGKRPPCVVS